MNHPEAHIDSPHKPEWRFVTVSLAVYRGCIHCGKIELVRSEDRS